jgi:hypothetical protein
MKTYRRRLKPTLDALEIRQVPASLVTPWADPQHLTISFAPDGARMGDQANSLTAALDAQFGTSDPHAWQKPILRAAQTWEAAADLNIGVVADGGQDFGAGGAPQGDARFGDIRVGAVPLSRVLLGLTQPPSLVAGTWGGDITLNSSASFADGTGNDLYTVALHEIGHALGLADSPTDTGSAMYGNYLGPRAGLDAADVAAIRALYGARPGDAFEGSQGNDTPATASPIAYDAAFPVTQLQTIRADLTTPSDVDTYRFTVPAGSTSASVRIQTSGVSAMLGQISVYDQGNNLLGTARATDPLAGDVAVPLSGLAANQTYLVKVQGASADPLGAGAYNLQLSYRASTSDLWSVAGTVPVRSGNTPNGTFATATTLSLNDPSVEARFQFSSRSRLSPSNSTDVYRFARPGDAAIGSTLTVTAWSTDSSGLNPRISVYDGHRRPVAATVLVNENGTYTVQWLNADDASYFVAVQAQGDPSASNPGEGRGHLQGGYFLGIDFRDPATTLDVLGKGKVGAGLDGKDVAIAAENDDLFHFALTGSASSATHASVQMTIYDQTGHAVARLKVEANQTRTVTVFLGAGTYTARFRCLDGADRDGDRNPPLKYVLTGAGLSDPIKVFGNPGSGGSGSGGDSGSGGGSNFVSGGPKV